VKLVTWNIRWCRGTDGVVDPQRIVDDARAFAGFDVLCLQKVAANDPDLDGSHGGAGVAGVSGSVIAPVIRDCSPNTPRARRYPPECGVLSSVGAAIVIGERVSSTREAFATRETRS
jgi:hypothetical protein